MDTKNYILSSEIIFDSKPDAVPYNYRISYKIAQVCLIMDMCCGRSGCSLLKLHMLSVSLSTAEDMKRLSDLIFGNTQSYTVVRLDPAVNHAVKYALAEKIIIQQKNGLFKLTVLGKSFVKGIIKNSELMANEKRYLFSIADKLTEATIKKLTSFWRYSNVENK